MSPRKSYTADAHEAAYATWRQCGQNIEATVRELRKLGYLITKPTLCDWREKFSWKERAARAEVIGQKASEAAGQTTEQMALASLYRVMEKYETYFETLTSVALDNQTMFAYIATVKAIRDIETKSNALKAACFLDFMKELIEWLSKHDVDAVPAIERNLDDFAAYAREKYAL